MFIYLRYLTIFNKHEQMNHGLGQIKQQSHARNPW